MKMTKNLMILNALKTAKYGKKEKAYALLIIDILEQVETFNDDLSNVYVDHNILEAIILQEHQSYLYDYFGRNKSEFPKRFLESCMSLNSKFSKEYLSHIEFSFEVGDFYYGAKGFGVRCFIRSIISKIMNPLKIKKKVQPLFVSIFNNESHFENSISIGWYSGKRLGRNVLNEQFEVSRKLNEEELKKLQAKIERASKTKKYRIADVEDIRFFIDEILTTSKEICV